MSLRSVRRRRTSASARLELADTRAVAACASSPRRPVIGSTCDTVVRYSVTPATDSRVRLGCGLGHRDAASTSTRVMSTAARIACTRGLVGESRAKASDSVNVNVCAPAPSGIDAAARAAQSTALRIGPRMNGVRDRRRDSPSDQVRRRGREGRGGRDRLSEVREEAPCRSQEARPTQQRGGTNSNRAVGGAAGATNWYVD